MEIYADAAEAKSTFGVAENTRLHPGLRRS